MGSSQSTRKCRRCGVEFLEDNMVEHLRDCVKASASGKADGSWDCTYSGPTSGVGSMSGAISAASRGALEYKK